MGRKKKKQTKPWCWYCNREFDDEKILIQHQKAKHFKCHICSKKLFTGPGLAIHCMQVHKETIDKIPCAVPGRENVNIEIYGMEGVPLDAEMGVSEEPATKQPKFTLGSIPTPAMPPAMGAGTVSPFGAMINPFGMPPGMPPFGMPQGMMRMPMPGMPPGMQFHPSATGMGQGQMPMPPTTMPPTTNAGGGGGGFPPMAMPPNLPPAGGPRAPPSPQQTTAAFPAYQQQAQAAGIPSGMRNNGTPSMMADVKKPFAIPPPLPNSAQHQPPSAITIKPPAALGGYTASAAAAAAKTRIVCPDELTSLEEHKFSILQRKEPFASAFDGRSAHTRGVGISGSYAGQNFRR